MTACQHVWVPAGLDPDDERICARCNDRTPASPKTWRALSGGAGQACQ